MHIETLRSAFTIVDKPVSGTVTTLHRYELVGNSLMRRQLENARPLSAEPVYLIDVLITDDEIGRFINATRGYLVPGRDQDLMDPETDVQLPRKYEVSLDLTLVIAKDLGVGPYVRERPRLATLDGRNLL